MTGDTPPEGVSQSQGQVLSWMLMSAVQHFAAGELARAEADCATLLQIDPDHAGALNLCGMLASRQGQPERAADLLTRATRADPGAALAWFNLGAALEPLGRREEAIEAYRRAQALNPQYLEAIFNLGNLLAAARRFEEAAAAYRQALALRPDLPQTHNNLGNALAGLGRTGEAEAAYRAALALDPDDPGALTNLANTLQALGRHAEGVEAAGRALALDPAHAPAWFARSELKTFAAGDPEIEQLRAVAAAAEASGRPVADRINLEFALAKALMDSGDPDPAFAHLDAANRLKRATFDYDVRDDVRGFEALAEVFDRVFLDRFSGAGDPSERPIFIVGMPRSGTTLVEQILASHPAVFGAGELDALMDAVSGVVGADLPLETLADRLGGLGRNDFRAIAARYLDTVRPVAEGAARFTDKMPANFRLVGLIGLILPNARIIHCTRDPVDTCFSCYTKQFSGQQHFAHDLRELGVFHRAYARLMGHWRAVMPPDRFIEAAYETLVDDLGGQARRLVQFCGLDWDEACLDFHRHDRPVRTASANQVRKPIYRSSIQRWRPYERHLQPLIRALEAP